MQKLTTVLPGTVTFARQDSGPLNSALVCCWGCGFERECYGLSFFGADCYCLLAGSVEFMPGDQGVGAGRKIFQVEFSVLLSDLEVRVSHDGHVCLHPRVDVALHRDGDFLACK